MDEKNQQVIKIKNCWTSINQFIRSPVTLVLVKPIFSL